MSSCPMCEFDPVACVENTYTLLFHSPAQSLNQVGTNGKHSHNYRKARKKWERLLKPYARLQKAEKKRRILFTRYWGKGQRAYDYGNLVGGFKPLLDVIVRADLLIDDSPKHCADYYKQYRASDGKAHVIVVIEDIKHAT